MFEFNDRMHMLIFCKQFEMRMPQGRICILGKIEFSTDNENAEKNEHVKL